MARKQMEALGRQGQLVGPAHEGEGDDDALEVLEADEQDARGPGDALATKDEFEAEDEDEEEGDEVGEFDEFDDDLFAPGWSWQDREFAVEELGTLTRGMLVIDRRASAALPSSRLTNRTEQVAPSPDPNAPDPSERLGRLSITSHSHEEHKLDGRGSGARVVVATPGNESLRFLLLQRIWGVSIGLA